MLMSIYPNLGTAGYLHILPLSMIQKLLQNVIPSVCRLSNNAENGHSIPYNVFLIS